MATLTEYQRQWYYLRSHTSVRWVQSSVPDDTMLIVWNLSTFSNWSNYMHLFVSSKGFLQFQRDSHTKLVALERQRRPLMIYILMIACFELLKKIIRFLSLRSLVRIRMNIIERDVLVWALFHYNCSQARTLIRSSEKKSSSSTSVITRHFPWTRFLSLTYTTRTEIFCYHSAKRMDWTSGYTIQENLWWFFRSGLTDDTNICRCRWRAALTNAASGWPACTCISILPWNRFSTI